MPRCEQCNRDFVAEQALLQHNADKHRTGLTRHDVKQMKKQEKDEQRKQEQDKISRKRKIKTMTIIAVVFLGFIGLIAFVVYLPKPETTSQKIGPVGSTHQHADFKVYINSEQLDFSSPQYQVRAREVHVEGGDGDVIHKHATGVTVGHFLQTLGLRINSTCIKTDKGGEYCSNEDATLKYYLKTQEMGWENVEDLPDRDITDLDKYLITYGNETDLSTQQASVTDKARIESGKGPKQSMPI